VQPSNRLLSAWAKSNKADESLSLIRHSEDAAAIAGHIWDDWLPRSTKNVLAGALTNDEARVLARWLAGVHDVGKLSPAFASQVGPLAGAMRDAGLDMALAIAKRREVPHSVVSHRAVAGFLEGHGMPKRVAETYAVIAGGHHGTPPVSGQLSRAEDRGRYGGPEWKATRNELLEHISELTGASDLFEKWSALPLTPQQQALWTGFVIMSDWIASSDYFPLGDRRESVTTAAEAWEDLELPPPWRAAPPSTIDELMAARFTLPDGATANSVQRAVAEAATSMAEPGLIVIEAPMGIGKTEAALAAAEYLAARFGQGGVFVGLPTMATSNAMFRRVLSWIESQESDSVASAVLAHGKASLEDHYRGLLTGKSMMDVGRDADEPGHSCRTEVVAHHWLSGRKKGLLADFAVGTIDQLLFAALRARHLVLRHLGIVNKVIVIDEVHAADTYMTMFLVRVLEWLGAYRVPVILMSATLPAAQRIALVSAYESGRGWTTGDDTVLEGDIGYPVITSVDGHRRVVDPTYDGRHTTVSLERIDDDPTVLVDSLRAALRDGGCVGIVRNTVARAQETARLLDEHFPGEVVLLHSRFVARHRADLESALVSELGRDGGRPHRRIVVGTQVIEQSLDVDFDLMVSDLAPIDLLFQRVGRLHRHRRARPAPVSDARLILTGVEDWSAQPPRAIPATRRIYGELAALRALAVLDKRDGLTLPADIAALVQEAYSDDCVVPAGWNGHHTDAQRADRKHRRASESRARPWRIWSPDESDDLVDWLAENVGEVDDARGQARVRDTDEGIDVILTCTIDGAVHLPRQCGGEPVPTDFCPDNAVARRILTSTVRLPLSLTHPGIADRTIAALEERMYQGWQESRWLAGELVLELGDDMTTQLQGYDIRYDDIEGLVVSKGDEQP